VCSLMTVSSKEAGSLGGRPLEDGLSLGTTGWFEAGETKLRYGKSRDFSDCFGTAIGNCSRLTCCSSDGLPVSSATQLLMVFLHTVNRKSCTKSVLSYSRLACSKCHQNGLQHVQQLVITTSAILHESTTPRADIFLFDGLFWRRHRERVNKQL
jgi:hypothetical protein